MDISNHKVATDCKYFEGNKPCKFHKLDRRECQGCTDYRKIETHILIVKLDALGDVLRTTSILPSLHSEFSNASVTWVTRKSAMILLEGNPLIDRVLAIEQNYLEYLLSRNFSVAICLDADQLSASILKIAKSKQKYGFVVDDDGRVIPVNSHAERWYLTGLNDSLKSANRETYQAIIHQICQLTNLNAKPQLHISENAKENILAFESKHALKKFKRTVGINTGGGKRWQYKKWILEYYPKLILLLKDAYPDYAILLLGGPEEKEFNSRILEEVGQSVIDGGCDNSIVEFAAIINICDIFLTPDSLGMHISIALGKTTLVTVGPTSPWELDVYNNGEIIYDEKLNCISCYRSSCDKKVNCMNSLSPDLLFSKLKKYL